MTNDTGALFKVTVTHEASFEFDSQELEINGFYRFDGCFNYEEKVEDDYEGRCMLHVCDINRMILFLELLKKEALSRGFEA